MQTEPVGDGHDPQPYHVTRPLHFRGKIVPSPPSWAHPIHSSLSRGPAAAIPQTKRFLSRKLEKQMSGCLKATKSLSQGAGVGRPTFGTHCSDSERVCVCVDGRDRSWDMTQKTGPGMAEMCRRAHLASKSLFGTRRRTKSQTCG